MMQSALRRLAKKAVLSALFDTPADVPSFEVDPSRPTTKLTVTAISLTILNFSPFYQRKSSLEIENRY
jgi:hypothetical protein